jgi:hypothetical protein
MNNRHGHLRSVALALTLSSAFAGAASAATCVGACGIAGPDGVVVAPPNSGSYRWISTYGGVDGAGQISGVVGTNGSAFTTSAFSAVAGDNLEFYFNYVTSDGQQAGGVNYEDYTWVELQTTGGDHVAYIFTARTEPSGSIVPGLGLPDVSATLTPASVEITPGAPNWSPLGPDYNNTCWGPGCGYTGWVKSNYAIQEAGAYQLVFGVSNFEDTLWDSGLAFDGIRIAGSPVDDDDAEYENEHPGPVPEPAAWAMMILGFGGMGVVARRRRRLSAAS